MRLAGIEKGWSPDDLVAASRWAGVRKTRAWQVLVHPVNSEVAFTPAMPFKKGHLALPSEARHDAHIHKLPVVIAPARS